MRIVSISTLLLMFALCAPAYAEDVSGKIIKIDEDAEIVTLSNGKDYRLPGEFDYSSIETGMPVILTYEISNDIRYISTIEDAEE